ncbi:MAG: hypothetical protein Q7T50_08135, partial [Candidatus Magasanikbacteria bacterium]|nr:hypothetical protein [Candidatus Magasanikbacteria bacterium]
GFTSELFKIVDFEKTVVIACQHILPTNLVMFNYLFAKGLRPESVFLIGKTYSTQVKAEKAFLEKGVYVHKYGYSSHESFDVQFVKALDDFLVCILKSVGGLSFDNIIVLDDGGELIKQINAKKVFENVKVVTCEQTTSGYENLVKINKNLRFPVINVARSKAKLDVESPIIAQAVIKILEKQLRSLEKKPKKILVVGAGAIGINIFEQLREKFQVSLFDMLPYKSHFDGNLDQIISGYDVVIGSTGTTIISEKQFRFLKNGTVLASASSSDREFDSVKLRLLVKETNDPHFDVLTNGIYLLNSGFPINFNGTEVEKTSDIQLTRALMFSAICLAKIKKYKNGLVELDKGIQRKIIDKYLEN